MTNTEEKTVRFGDYLDADFDRLIDACATTIADDSQDIAVALLELVDADGTVRVGLPASVKKLAMAMRAVVDNDAYRNGFQIA